jgi:hypothetical protein
MDKSKFLVDVPFEFVDARIDKILCICPWQVFEVCPIGKKHVFKGNVSCVVGAELGSQVLHA